MAESVWGPLQKSLGLMIPVLMQEKKMEREDAQFQQKLNAAAQEAQAEREENQAKLEDEALKAKLKYTADMMKESYKAGDKKGVEAFGTPLAQADYPVPARQAEGPPGPDGQIPIEWLAAPQDPEKDPTPSGLSKLLTEMNSLSEGDPNRKFYMDKLTPKGMKIVQGPDGQLTIQTGVSEGGNELTRATQNKVQKDLLSANDNYRRMVGIAKKFEPRFQQLNTRLKAFETKWQEKLQGTALEKWVGKANPEDKKLLEEYTAYRREAIESLNAYIKEITGAQMSEKEAARLMKAMPNPGMGLFDGDSPTEFITKMQDVMHSLSRSIARLNYVKSKGLTSVEDVGLDSMDGIMDRRGEELEKELSDQGVPKDQWESMVMDQLSKEFGLVF